MYTHGYLFLILVAAASHAAHLHGAIAGAAATTCIPQERDALLDFKRGITNDSAGHLASWQEGDEDCCRWGGVRCSNWTGHVLELHLHSEGYDDQGKPIERMIGQISQSLLSLERLEHLDLSGNILSGPDGDGYPIPKFLGSLKNLKYLNLSSIYIPFSGGVPPQLGNLSNLQVLDLSYMGYTYSADVSWLSHLHNLRCLNLCQLSLGAGWAHVVNMIPSLRVLDLSQCFLTSANQSFPHLNLTHLEKLDLSYNYFDQPIASCWFWNITGLKLLALGSTSLYDPFPSALQDMTSLQFLDLSQAALHGELNLTNLCNLEYLDMDRNQLYGDITEFLDGLLHYCPSKKLRLSSNNITGVLPNRMVQLTRLEHLDLSDNSISGVLPNSMEQLTSLESLYLTGNKIAGVLPNWMGRLTSLEEIGLAKNNIGGILPNSMEQLTSLKSLEFSYNEISGVLPHWMGQLTSLTEICLANNNISGILPNSMGQLTNLSTLDLTRNNITGPLPSFVGHLTSLIDLDLSFNHFTGHMPCEIGLLSNLNYLHLHNNELDGVITEEHFASLKSLQYIDLSYNSLTLEISSEWQPPFRLDQANFASCRMGPLFPAWLKWMVEIGSLDISNAGINDTLPEWFCGTFSMASYLNLSNNQIHGALPTNMENMSVGYLYLGSNQLTGPIPPMPISLIELDLSGNYLSGPMP